MGEEEGERPFSFLGDALFSFLISSMRTLAGRLSLKCNTGVLSLVLLLKGTIRTVEGSTREAALENTSSAEEIFSRTAVAPCVFAIRITSSTKSLKKWRYLAGRHATPASGFRALFISSNSSSIAYNVYGHINK